MDAAADQELTPSARRRRERRELVARLARGGRGIAEIAETLGISEPTVRTDCRVMNVTVSAHREALARYRTALEKIAEGVIDSAEIAREALRG